MEGVSLCAWNGNLLRNMILVQFLGAFLPASFFVFFTFLSVLIVVVSFSSFFSDFFRLFCFFFSSSHKTRFSDFQKGLLFSASALKHF